jgi:hypothetical protein
MQTLTFDDLVNIINTTRTGSIIGTKYSNMNFPFDDDTRTCDGTFTVDLTPGFIRSIEFQFVYPSDPTDTGSFAICEDDELLITKTGNEYMVSITTDPYEVCQDAVYDETENETVFLPEYTKYIENNVTTYFFLLD